MGEESQRGEMRVKPLIVSHISHPTLRGHAMRHLDEMSLNSERIHHPCHHEIICALEVEKIGMMTRIFILGNVVTILTPAYCSGEHVEMLACTTISIIFLTNVRTRS